MIHCNVFVTDSLFNPLQIREDIHFNNITIYPVVHNDLTDDEMKVNNKIKVSPNRLLCTKMLVVEIIYSLWIL